jgi:rRNA maturation RNase YbeY
VTRAWKIHISKESAKLRISSAKIRSIAKSVLELSESEIAISAVNELHILLINDARMREINFEFRAKDKATDVLSFPQYQPNEINGKKKLRAPPASYLGDLVISTETTISQAKRFGVSVSAELTRLIIHGVLHLIGYDHEKVPPAKAQKMRRRERQIMSSLKT